MCPIYEYECPKCKNLKEVFEFSLDDKTKKVICDECSETMQKILSKGSFILKGGCWFRDGYSKKGAKK